MIEVFAKIDDDESDLIFIKSLINGCYDYKWISYGTWLNSENFFNERPYEPQALKLYTNLIDSYAKMKFIKVFDINE